MEGDGGLGVYKLMCAIRLVTLSPDLRPLVSLAGISHMQW